MEMNAAKREQYRYKLTGDDVSNWQPNMLGRYVFFGILFALIVSTMMLVNAPWQ